MDYSRNDIHVLTQTDDNVFNMLKLLFHDIRNIKTTS